MAASWRHGEVAQTETWRWGEALLSAERAGLEVLMEVSHEGSEQPDLC